MIKQKTQNDELKNEKLNSFHKDVEFVMREKRKTCFFV